MNRDEIIRMSREAGVISTKIDGLERFAQLVAAAERENWPDEMKAMERQVEILTDELAKAVATEREACAKVCEEMRDAWVNRPVPLLGYAVEHDGAAKAIRARGEA